MCIVDCTSYNKNKSLKINYIINKLKIRYGFTIFDSNIRINKTRKNKSKYGHDILKIFNSNILLIFIYYVFNYFNDKKFKKFKNKIILPLFL